MPKFTEATLSTREIFEELIQNRQVLFPSFNTEEACSLLDNLNVMKARENKLLRDLGFEEKDVIIRMKPINNATLVGEGGICFYLEQKKAKKTYTVFIISEGTSEPSKPTPQWAEKV